MKNFAIIRVEKLKTFGAISASAQHCFRERPTPNADTGTKNQTIGAVGSAAVIQAVRQRISTAGRADKQAVPCLEYIVTASQNMDDNYFNDSLRWLRKQHGSENVISATIHNDETTRHMTVYVVPLVRVAEKTRKRSVNVKGGGREIKTEIVPAHSALSAKAYTGGRAALSRLQDDFYEEVGKQCGLVRGVKRQKGDAAKHQSVKRWYETKEAIAGIAPVLAAVEKTKPTLSQMRDDVDRLDGLAVQLAQEERRLQDVAKSLALGQKAVREAEKAAQKREKEHAETNERIRQVLIAQQQQLAADSAALATERKQLEKDIVAGKAKIEALIASAREQNKNFSEAFKALDAVQKEAALRLPQVQKVVVKSPKKTQGVTM